MSSEHPNCRPGRTCPRPSILLAIPVYNESRYVEKVLTEVRRYARHILVIDDGSTDSTPMELARQPVEVIRHAENRGYGRSMQDMMRWAAFDSFEWLITMDCDEQHEPESIPDFVAAIREDDADVISGSRYLNIANNGHAPPADRRTINELITKEINERLHLRLTDSFCGFKAYRVAAIERLRLSVDGYDFPMQFWVQAAAHQLRIREISIRLIYNDPTRTFGGPLNDPETRLTTYRATLHREVSRWADRLPTGASAGLLASHEGQALGCCI